MLDFSLCVKLAKEHYDCVMAGSESWAFDQCFLPLVAELGRDGTGALEFLRSLPMEQFEMVMGGACYLVDACVGSRVAYADALYELAKERGASEFTMQIVSGARTIAAQ